MYLIVRVHNAFGREYVCFSSKRDGSTLCCYYFYIVFRVGVLRRDLLGVQLEMKKKVFISLYKYQLLEKKIVNLVDS